MILHKKLIEIEVVRYLTVGGLTSLVYFGFIALFVEVVKVDYRISISSAYVLAVAFHFLANRQFTFRSGDSPVLHQIIRYSVVLMINYIVTICITWLLVGKFGFSTYLAAGVSILVTVAISYIALKKWVYRRRSEKE